MVKDLSGRVGVVTGAASGIGRALALRLASEGMRLVLLDTNDEGLRETEALADHGEAMLLRATNVACRAEVEDAARFTVERFGAVDLLVNNAGVASVGTLGELDYETLRWTLDVNLWGVIHGCKTFLPHLLDRREANLVNVSSIYGLIGVPGHSAYCASKFAVRGFTEALRVELRKTSLAVTLVYPAGVETGIQDGARIETSMSEERRARVQARMKGRKRCSPEEAAEAIVRGIRRDAPRVLIGRGSRFLDLLSRLLPSGHARIVGRYVDHLLG